MDIKGGGEPSAVCIIGVDPQTGMCMWWAYTEAGDVGKYVMTRESEGVFLLQGEGQGPSGKVSQKIRSEMRGPDSLELELVEKVLDGEKQPTGKGIWTRKR
jgi:hypothetical protein